MSYCIDLLLSRVLVSCLTMQVKTLAYVQFYAFSFSFKKSAIYSMLLKRQQTFFWCLYSRPYTLSAKLLTYTSTEVCITVHQLGVNVHVNIYLQHVSYVKYVHS
jgi:hypothetical protein